MIQNKIVVRYQDGRISKGYTNNFMPNKDVFHLIPLDAPAGSKPLDVYVNVLKAVFFVKDFTGDKQYQEKKTFDTAKPAVGKKIKVVFKDGEEVDRNDAGLSTRPAGFLRFSRRSRIQSGSSICFLRGYPSGLVCLSVE